MGITYIGKHFSRISLEGELLVNELGCCLGIVRNRRIGLFIHGDGFHCAGRW